jgi:hypothetical protein
MDFVSENEYKKAIGQVESYVKRENKIKYLNEELGHLLKDFIKFKFRTKNNRTIFAGYYIDENNKEKMIIGETVCDKDDVFDKFIGKIVAVRKALDMEIDDIIDVVEPKRTSGITVRFDSIDVQRFAQQLATTTTNIKW